MKAQLLAELNRWREEVIRDQGVSDAFRAENVFPSERPAEQTVGQWAVEHADEFNFHENGVPGWYPTRTLRQWREVQKIWEPWVFRDVDSEMRRPVIPFTKKPQARKK